MAMKKETVKWGRRVNRQTVPLIISGGWSPGAYDIVRALGMEGIRSAVASSQPNDIAFYSKDCIQKIVLPDFEPENDAEILQVLQEFSESQHAQPILYYASDPELKFVSQHRVKLQEFFQFLLPSDDLLEHLVNKALFGTFARQHGLPIPSTMIAHDTEEVRSMIDSIRFPCIVKPAYSQDWIWDTEEQRIKYGPYKKALRRFSDKTALLEFCTGLPQRSSGFLIQSYIDGRDESIASFHGYFDEQSNCLGHFVGRKIRTYPPRTGGSAYIRTIYNPELAQISIAALQRIGFRGPVKIDFKWDPNARNYTILEINPRYNLWFLLGAYAGVNLAAIAFHHLRGEHTPPKTQYRDDYRLLFFKQDFRGYWEGYRSTGEWTFAGYLKSLFGRKCYRVYDPNDPVPFLLSSLSFLKRNAKRLSGKLSQLVPSAKLRKHLPSDNVVHAHNNAAKSVL